jgi:hypothetical protein
MGFFLGLRFHSLLKLFHTVCHFYLDAFILLVLAVLTA